MQALSAYSLQPGFGFHPTDVELISHYLKRKILGLKIDFEVITEVDIYKHEPWDLPARCPVPSRDCKWHFFASRDKKYPNSFRTNRATEAGYWKSTGKDRSIRNKNHVIGTKKTLVFHEGRPPSGKRTDWIMHEYYVSDKEFKDAPDLKDSYVLCRVTKRNGWGPDSGNVSENVPPQSESVDECSKQREVVSSVTQEKSSNPSESVEDIDAWLEELFDPNFSGSLIHSEVNAEQTEGLSSLAVNQEPINPDFHHDVSDESHLLFPVDEFYDILNFDPKNHGFFEQHNIGNFSTFNGQQEDVDVDVSEYLNNVSEEFTGNNDGSSWTGIHRRERKAKPSSTTTVSNRIKLQVSKMESRNGEILSQIFEVSQDVHLDHGDSTRPENRVVARKAFRARRISGLSPLAFVSCFFCMMGILALTCYFLLRGARGFGGGSKAVE